jgi:hypothetical protein
MSKETKGTYSLTAQLGPALAAALKEKYDAVKRFEASRPGNYKRDYYRRSKPLIMRVKRCRRRLPVRCDVCGKNFTNATLIATGKVITDSDGFKRLEQACPHCLPEPESSTSNSLQMREFERMGL